jgi:hypothetical protein
MAEVMMPPIKDLPLIRRACSADDARRCACPKIVDANGGQDVGPGDEQGSPDPL